MEVLVMNNILTKELYLELLKKTILHEIWLKSEPDREIRRQGLDWPEHAHSMIGRLRMENLQHCMATVLKEGVEGDFIETGVWRGGACIFMRGFLKVNEIDNRCVWVADSFEGLPEPDEANSPMDKGSTLHTFDFLRVSLEEVQENFRRYDLLDDQVCFLKGWFEDTLPAAPIEKLAVLRLDGDMYGSTMDSLRNLYPKVSKGGFIIIDDYGLPNCAAAVTDFRKNLQIDEPLIRIDTIGVYWRKIK
jgi:O-methyltransferase